MDGIYHKSVIKRDALELLHTKLAAGKVVVLYGPRRVGKTTLLTQLIAKLKKSESPLVLQGEDHYVQEVFSSQSIDKLKQVVGTATLLVIDEAQAIPNIGLNLKLLVDSHPQLKVIASGSASFDLAQKVGEPLAGRKKTVLLYPISVSEWKSTMNSVQYNALFEEFLIFGGYPELLHIKNRKEKIDYMAELVDSALYKDILMLENVRMARKIRDLLILLAFQIGKEVSTTELASSLDMSKNTVARYLDLLEKSFVIFNIRGFSRNLRKEVTKTSRYYFYDNGVRNALIDNFNPLNRRDDTGELWENWLAVERLKKQQYAGLHVNHYFWRTYDQKEIDWIEESGGKLEGYEFSWSEKKIRKSIKQEFLQAYPQAKLHVIHRGNYEAFLS